ncbi:hydrolase 1, exosortase A system-associated [Sphingomonas sp.]|uniref:hydrolase 1, exosortase A system-associated n=1 Tax=Sphingomonas sp. TaxID=28214 RepID=UPI002DD620D1|nr:hydrolase 1, exosortase A system-associated [Sphingomonas sp.]
MRRVIEIACAGEMIVGTLDEGAENTGLLIVSGGNEIRSGAHRGMALLAQALSAEGVPVLRYDRRGIGDSTGENAGFEASAEDIAAAAGAFRREAGVTRIVGFGNCDAATALTLFHARAGIDALVLSNPWTGGGDDALPQAAAIRARYAERLRDPGEWLRLLRGGIDLRKLFSGLRKAAQSGREDGDLVDRMALSLAASAVPTTILLAARDNTAIAFRDAWAKSPNRTDAATFSLDSASHSYAGAADKAWLKDRLREAVG